MQGFNTTAQDLLHSDFRVYVEGVQIPFESGSINNSYGEVPEATIVLPPHPGLQEVGRNYFPKVQIFWKDPSQGLTPLEVKELGSAHASNYNNASYKLIFNGLITGNSDSKNTDAGGGSQSMTFSCQHPITILRDVLVRFANQSIPATLATSDVNAEGAAESAEWTLSHMMINALMGVKQNAAEDDVAYVPSDKWDDLKGTPGVLRVLWNTLKRDARRKTGNDSNSEALDKLFIPVIEDGLKFWDRMMGHPVIEEGIEKERYEYEQGTGVRGGSEEPITGEIMIPATFRSFIGEAAQKDLTVQVMNGMLNGLGSPEVYNFSDIIRSTIDRLEYDMIILTSPIMRPNGTITEYLVKPRLPYYYAPICNVVLPNMLNSITVNNNFQAMPTRKICNSNLSGLSVRDLTYTAPHSIRYARGGEGGDLLASMSSYNNRVGKYEWGQGIRAEVSQLPPMYNLMSQKYKARKAAVEEAPLYYGKDEEAVTPVEDENIVGAADQSKARDAWDKVYPGAEKYNPLADASNISGFQRLNFLFADHDFAMSLSRTRTGQASGCFNPYAVCGYPMEWIDAVPSRESYHGMCTSVSHAFSAAGHSSTSYSMVAINTLSELARYNIPSTNPYLLSVFDMDDDPRIYNNVKAYETACKVYQDVFGVGAAEPALLQSYFTGKPIPFDRDPDSGCWTTDTNSGLYNTQQGSLILVARNLVSMYDLEIERGSAFIHIDDWTDADMSSVKKTENVLVYKRTHADSKIGVGGVDIESSPFLEYTEEDKPNESEYSYELCAPDLKAE